MSEKKDSIVEVKEEKITHGDSNLKRIIKKYSIAFVLLAMIIGISIVEPKFLAVDNILNVLVQSSIYGIMALGLTLIIISKGIDLSAGSIVAFAGIIAASLGQITNATTKFFPNMGELPVIVPIIAAMGVGALLGAVNGGFIAFTGIPAFIATLGMTTIARGMTLMYTGGKPITQLIPSFTALGGKIGIIPVPIIIYGIVAFITWILLNHTQFGKSIYAIGGNIHAAEISGVNIKRNTVLIYLYAGIM